MKAGNTSLTTQQIAALKTQLKTPDLNSELRQRLEQGIREYERANTQIKALDAKIEKANKNREEASQKITEINTAKNENLKKFKTSPELTAKVEKELNAIAPNLIKLYIAKYKNRIGRLDKENHKQEIKEYETRIYSLNKALNYKKPGVMLRNLTEIQGNPHAEIQKELAQRESHIRNQLIKNEQTKLEKEANAKIAQEQGKLNQALTEYNTHESQRRKFEVIKRQEAAILEQGINIALAQETSIEKTQIKIGEAPAIPSVMAAAVDEPVQSVDSPKPAFTKTAEPKSAVDADPFADTPVPELNSISPAASAKATQVAASTNPFADHDLPIPNNSFTPLGVTDIQSATPTASQDKNRTVAKADPFDIDFDKAFASFAAPDTTQPKNVQSKAAIENPFAWEISTDSSSKNNPFDIDATGPVQTATVEPIKATPPTSDAAKKTTTKAKEDENFQQAVLDFLTSTQTQSLTQLQQPKKTAQPGLVASSDLLDFFSGTAKSAVTTPETAKPIVGQYTQKLANKGAHGVAQPQAPHSPDSMRAPTARPKENLGKAAQFLGEKQDMLEWAKDEGVHTKKEAQRDKKREAAKKQPWQLI